MTALEHPKAVYYDKTTGRREIIWASQLSDPEKLAKAKNEELWDLSEQIRLGPRISHKNTPHFYEITEERETRKVFAGEKDPTHDARVEDLTLSLQGLGPWFLSEMGQYNKDGTTYSDGERIPEYKWGAEVYRIFDENTVVRHDIFGQSTELSMSVRRPSIAIEVINTHFPEEEAFSAFLRLSKEIPYIVLFDFTEFKNAFLRVDPPSSRLAYRPWTYKVKDGALWRGNTLTTITSSTQFEIDVKNMLNRWRNKGK